jgi:hypothetical protein
MGTEHDLDRSLRAMLDHVPPHDATAIRATLEAAPATAQRRFRWIPAFGGGARGGRPAFAIGGVAAVVMVIVIATLSLTLPSSGSVLPGAASPSPGPKERPSGTVLEGQIICGLTDAQTGTVASNDIGSEEDPLLRRETRGFGYDVAVATMSDARLDGEIINYWDSDEYVAGISPVGQVGTGTWRITNDKGAWQGSFHNVFFADDSWGTTVYPLYGEAAYEGLVALWEFDYLPVATAGRCGWDVHGLILDAQDLPTPPLPQP